MNKPILIVFFNQMCTLDYVSSNLLTTFEMYHFNQSISVNTKAYFVPAKILFFNYGWEKKRENR